MALTIRILFRYSATAPDGTSRFCAAAQSAAVGYQVPWNDYISALRAHARGANDIRANASLPGAALSSNIITKSANGRSVGLTQRQRCLRTERSRPAGPDDGIVTLHSSFPAHRPVGPGNFDAQRATEHEMDEVIGLGSRLGHPGNDLRPQDLFKLVISWRPEYQDIRNTLLFD